LLITFPLFRRNPNRLFFSSVWRLFFLYVCVCVLTVFWNLQMFSFRRVYFSRNICLESGVLLVLVFEYNSAILVTGCHGSVTRIAVLIDRSYKCWIFVSNVCLYISLLYSVVQSTSFVCDAASFVLSFIVAVNLSLIFSNSVFYQATVLAQHNFSVHMSVVRLSFFRSIKLSNLNFLCLSLYMWNWKC